MSEVESLNQILGGGVAVRHAMGVGETKAIRLPSIPLTADTEFVQLRTDLSGARDQLEVAPIDQGEGTLSPSVIHVRALSPGQGVIRVGLEDVLSGEPIVGVVPLEIVIVVDKV